MNFDHKPLIKTCLVAYFRLDYVKQRFPIGIGPGSKGGWGFQGSGNMFEKAPGKFMHEFIYILLKVDNLAYLSLPNLQVLVMSYSYPLKKL